MANSYFVVLGLAVEGLGFVASGKNGTQVLVHSSFGSEHYGDCGDCLSPDL